MSFVDVIFPINLGPLTYRCPDALKDQATPGMIVSAPLRSGMAKGVIYRKITSPPSAKLREISQFHGDLPVFSRGMLRLISWMADYYLAPEGLILKQAFPAEIFSKTKPKRHLEAVSAGAPDLAAVSESVLDEISGLICRSGYQTLLAHSPSALHEYSLAAALLCSARNIIVLLPEITQANLFYAIALKGVGDRACLLHSDMAAGKRSENIDGIISGRHDIVIGTRASLFAPMKSPAFIIVLHEHSPSYKLEEGIRFNIRDTAVMRGFIEKIPVLLTSTAPSIDSWFNARSGKYGLIRLQQDVPRPKIRIVDMRFSKKVRPYLSKAVFDAAKRCIRKEERVMFVINRRGHSTMLTCRECGATEKCADCGIPLVLHKDRNILHCHYCGRDLPVPEFCATCKSPDLELLGAGTQKIEADISELFGIGAVRFDSDRARRKSTIRELVEQASSDSSKIMVGTKMMTKRIGASFAFSVAAVLNIDNSLNIPDFRAREKAYQDITDILDLAGPDGEVLIQTRFPQEPLFRHLRENTYESFAAEELSVRKALGFPPYSRLINVLASGSVNVPDKIRKSVGESAADIEILGPTEMRTKKGTTEYSILLKHSNRKTLHAAARAVLNAFKNVKEARIRIDVDPY